MPSRRSQSMTTVGPRTTASRVKRTRTITVTRLVLAPQPATRRAHLPPEILDCIAEAYCRLALEDASGFAPLSALSMTSKPLRAVVLHRFLREHVVDLHCKPRARYLTELTSMHAYITRLDSTSQVLNKYPMLLPRLDRLEALAIEFRTDGLFTLRDSIMTLLPPLARRLPVLRSLTMNQLPSIEPYLLRLIARCLPALHNLELRAFDRLDYDCCWTCLADSAMGVVHSPIPDQYCLVEDLAHAFGDALAGLGRLERLVLGVFLSDEAALQHHIDAHSFVDVHVFANLSYSMPAPMIRLEWCVRCDEGRAGCVAARAGEAAGILRGYLPTLREIGWAGPD